MGEDLTFGLPPGDNGPVISAKEKFHQELDGGIEAP